jgi:hypothetical protein
LAASESAAPETTPLPLETATAAPAPATTVNADGPRYNLVFDGTVVDGFDLEEVKTRLAHLLKSSPEKTEALFSGKRFVLKKNTTRQQGESALSKLRAIGAHSQLVKVEA